MNVPINVIKTLLNALATSLCSSIESGDREKALAAQKTFTDTIAIVWTSLEEGDDDQKLKSISRLGASWAIHELPNQILDPMNDEEIKRELKLFQRSLVVIG